MKYVAWKQSQTTSYESIEINDSRDDATALDADALDTQFRAMSLQPDQKIHVDSHIVHSAALPEEKFRQEFTEHQKQLHAPSRGHSADHRPKTVEDYFEGTPLEGNLATLRDELHRSKVAPYFQSEAGKLFLKTMDLSQLAQADPVAPPTDDTQYDSRPSTTTSQQRPVSVKYESRPPSVAKPPSQGKQRPVNRGHHSSESNRDVVATVLAVDPPQVAAEPIPLKINPYTPLPPIRADAAKDVKTDDDEQHTTDVAIVEAVVEAVIDNATTSVQLEPEVPQDLDDTLSPITDSNGAGDPVVVVASLVAQLEVTARATSSVHPSVNSVSRHLGFANNDS